MRFLHTEFGFDWGGASITRMASDSTKGWVIIRIATPKLKDIQILVTKTGKVRIFNSDGEFMSPMKTKPKTKPKQLAYKDATRIKVAIAKRKAKA